MSGDEGLSGLGVGALALSAALVATGCAAKTFVGSVPTGRPAGARLAALDLPRTATRASVLELQPVRIASAGAEPAG